MSLPKRFPDRDEIASVRAEAELLEPGAEADDKRRVSGRVVGRREMGKLAFLDLVDRSGRIQLLCDTSRTGPIDVDLGDIVGVTGSPARAKRGEPSIAVDELELLAKIQRPLPDTFHGVTDVETRYRQRYLDLLMNEETRADFELRTRIVAAVRRHLDDQGFLEVETPVLQPRYGGGFAEPFVTHYNALDADYFLRIATELYLKRLIVGGLEKVYELGKDFRNEGLSYKHVPEFTMLEWYEAYTDYRDQMERVEQLIEGVARETMGGTKVTYRGHEVDLKAPWRRIKLVDALAEQGVWTRDPDELRSTRRPRAQPLRRAGPDRTDIPARLPRRALALRPYDRRGSRDRRAVRVLRRRHGARQRVLRAQRPRRAGRPLRAAGRRSGGRAGRPRLRRGARIRDAADGWGRAGRRPADDGPGGPRQHPRRGSLSRAPRALLDRA